MNTTKKNVTLELICKKTKKGKNIAFLGFDVGNGNYHCVSFDRYVIAELLDVSVNSLNRYIYEVFNNEK